MWSDRKTEPKLLDTLYIHDTRITITLSKGRRNKK